MTDSGNNRQYDRELSLKGILGFSLGVVAAVVLGAAAVWWMSLELRQDLASTDPAPSVIPEARQAYEPPGPRLQERPEAELRALRVEEEHVLTSYEWVDEASGVARIPVERAMEILAAEAAAAPVAEPAEPVTEARGEATTGTEEEVATEVEGEAQPTEGVEQ